MGIGHGTTKGAFANWKRPKVASTLCLIQTRKLCCRKETARCRSYSLQFANNNIYYRLKSSQAWKAGLQSSKHTGAKQYLTRAVERLIFLIALIARLIILIARLIILIAR